MSFGLSASGFKMMRLEDILAEKRQRYRDKFGDNFDLNDSTPEGLIISIEAEREAKMWEAMQALYNSQYRHTSEGASLDNVLALTGNSRQDESYSKVKGIAIGEELTTVPVGTIISVQGNPEARFITTSVGIINIFDVDLNAFVSGSIDLQAIEVGPIQALAGTLNVIETTVSGMTGFTNPLDAEIGSNIESDADAKQRVDGELQTAGAATIEAIKSELSARPDVKTAIVFHNNKMVVDLEGRPPKTLDIVVLGDDDQALAEAIFLVIGGGVETIGDIQRNVIDSQGFEHLIKFSRPTAVPIYIEIDVYRNVNQFPVDGESQIENLILAYGEKQSVGQRVTVFGTNGLGSSFDSVSGIDDFNIRIGKTVNPTTDDNVSISAREIAEFDSSRIIINLI